MAQPNKYTLDDAVNELQTLVQNAQSFIGTELEPVWDKAERYYNGEVDLLTVENRSKVVKTEVRDAARNLMPSIMRVLLQARKIVEYTPNSIETAPWVEQQSEYVTQLFWASDGYRQLFSAIDEATRRRYGVLKVFHEPDPKPRFFQYTNAPVELFQQLKSAPNIEITEIEETDTGITFAGLENSPNGRTYLEAIPTYEFFIDQNSTSVADAEERGVHGHSRLITVSGARELGLDVPDAPDWDAEDPETTSHGGSSNQNRKYAQREANDAHDPVNQEFTLTEVYFSCDLEDNGYSQLYRFFLGGTSYEYIDHEKVDESPYEVVPLNLKAHTTVSADSLAEITQPMQDAGTSALRAALDNAHAANNPRHAANPLLTKFEDLMNTSALNAPIRTREQIQTIAIPFTGQGLMGILNYLDLDVQSKVGVTKASQGLDPDAMQSTDKNAVMNTIQTSQGQVELMVRNLVECALIPIFRKMLKIATENFSPVQVMRTKGAVIPVDLRTFNPDLIATPNVGLGTADHMQKQATLGFILQEQKQAMQQYGFDNPFTSLSQIYNTLEDIVEIGGITNVGRYFKVVTPQVEKKLAEQRQKAAQQQQQDKPIDPGKAHVVAEQARNRTKLVEINANEKTELAKLAQKTASEAESNDIKRDELVLKRYVDLAKVKQDERNDEVRKEQDGNDTSGGKGSGSKADAKPRPSSDTKDKGKSATG